MVRAMLTPADRPRSPSTGAGGELADRGVGTGRRARPRRRPPDDRDRPCAAPAAAGSSARPRGRPPPPTPGRRAQRRPLPRPAAHDPRPAHHGRRGRAPVARVGAARWASRRRGRSPACCCRRTPIGSPSMPAWWFHPLGIEMKRARPLIAVARVASKLWGWAGPPAPRRGRRCWRSCPASARGRSGRCWARRAGTTTPCRRRPALPEHGGVEPRRRAAWRRRPDARTARALSTRNAGACSACSSSPAAGPRHAGHAGGSCRCIAGDAARPRRR